jgi:DNA-binding NtrC family response regulator
MNALAAALCVVGGGSHDAGCAMQDELIEESAVSLVRDDARGAERAREGAPRTERIGSGVVPAALTIMADGHGPVKLEAKTLSIGRSLRCDLTLFDRSVSSLHARVRWVGDGWEIHDEQSTNGTWVDGVRVSSARLRPGLEIVLGRTVLRCARWERSGERGEDLEDEALFGASEPMRRLRREVALAARTPYPVLVRGESGSGKELVAQALRRLSAKPRAPFVALNAGALPESLVESELFGHERGAFTGANARRRGAFEQADGGVLFLDEVGELPLSQQAKLLRVLETGELRRVGAEAAVRVRVKFVCATHRDLAALVAEGRFREDLLYRVEQHSLRVPSLRERIEDLPSLCDKLCERISEELGRTLALDPAALDRLRQYEWPGNVRELLGVLRSAAARAPGSLVREEHLGAFETRVRPSQRKTDPPPTCSETLAPPPVHGLKAPRTPVPEGEALLALLESLGGSISALSRVTGRSRAALRERLRKARESRVVP